MDCTQSLVGTWASMTPLNAARPRAGVDVARGRETWGEEPTGVSKKSAEKREREPTGVRRSPPREAQNGPSRQRSSEHQGW